MTRKAYVFLVVPTPDAAAADAVGAKLGLAPSEVRVAKLHSGRDVTESHDWQLESPLPETAAVEAHLSALLGLLAPRAEAMRAIAETCEAGIHCQLDFKPLSDYPDDLPGYPPGLALSPDLLRTLADLRIRLSFAFFHH